MTMKSCRRQFYRLPHFTFPSGLGTSKFEQHQQHQQASTNESNPIYISCSCLQRDFPFLSSYLVEPKEIRQDGAFPLVSVFMVVVAQHVVVVGEPKEQGGRDDCHWIIVDPLPWFVSNPPVFSIFPIVYPRAVPLEYTHTHTHDDRLYLLSLPIALTTISIFRSLF